MKKRADGRYEQVITINGKRKTFYGKTQREINRKIYEYKGEAEKGVLFGTVADSWRENHMEKLSFGTQRSYSAPFSRIQETFHDKYINEVGHKEVQSFLSSLNMSFKSVSTHKTVISQIFDYAIVEFGVDIANPCDRIKLDSRLPRSHRQQATAEQEKAILETKPTELLLAPLIYYTGMRCGEALALTFRDIDYVNKTISINKSISHHGNQPYVSAPKTANAVRTVPLLPQLEALIGCGEPNEYVISGDKPLTKSALTKRWQKWEKDHNVRIDRHSIRHTYATKLYDAGVGIKSSQALLGHANASTTLNVYTHLNQSHVSEAAEKLKNVIS